METNETIVGWPEIQKYEVLEGFRENAELINSEEGIEKYGYSAYRIDNDWLKQANDGELRELTEEEIEAEIEKYAE